MLDPATEPPINHAANDVSCRGDDQQHLPWMLIRSEQIGEKKFRLGRENSCSEERGSKEACIDRQGTCHPPPAKASQPRLRTTIRTPMTPAVPFNSETRSSGGLSEGNGTMVLVNRDGVYRPIGQRR